MYVCMRMYVCLKVGGELVLLPGQLTPLVSTVLDVRIPGHVHVQGPEGCQECSVKGHDIHTPQYDRYSDEGRMPDVAQETSVLSGLGQQWFRDLFNLAVNLDDSN